MIQDNDGLKYKGQVGCENSLTKGKVLNLFNKVKSYKYLFEGLVQAYLTLDVEKYCFCTVCVSTFGH